MRFSLISLALFQQVGGKAPDFTLKNQAGKEVTLSEFRGKKNVLLSFYPKDHTPGWTAQLKTLRDNIKTLEEKDCVVLGISTDDVDSHKKFVEDLKLPFDLLADPDKKTHEAYGFKGTTRSLFLIDKEGVTRHVVPKLNLKSEWWEDLRKAAEALKK